MKKNITFARSKILFYLLITKNIMIKFKHLSLVLVFIASLFVSCEPKNNGGNDLTKDLFSIELSTANFQKFSAKITPNAEAANQNYMVGAISAEDFTAIYEDNDVALANHFISVAKEGDDVDFSQADNKFIFKGTKDVLLTNWCEIKAGTEYVVAAFTVDANGQCTSKITQATLTPTWEADDLILEVLEVTTDNIKISVMTSPELGGYYVAPLPINEYEFTYGSDPVKAMNDAITAIITGGGNFGENGAAFFGDQVIDMSDKWTLYQDEEWVILACGVEEDGEITTEVFTAEATTVKEVPEVSGTFNLTIGEVTPGLVEVSVGRHGEIGNYVVGAIVAGKFDELNGYLPYVTDYISEDLVTSGYDFANPNNEILFDKDSVTMTLDRTVWPYNTRQELAEGEWYVIVAFGVDALGRPNSTSADVYEEVYIPYSPELPVDGSLELKINETTIDNIVATVTKVGNVNNYVCAACPTENFINDYNEDIEKLIADICHTQISSDLAVADGARVFDESGTIELGYSWPIKADTEYTVVAFGIARDTKEPTTDAVWENCRSKKPELSENVITITSSDVKQNSVMLHVDVTNSDPYYLNVFRAEEIEGKTDAEISDMIMDIWGQQFDQAPFHTTGYEEWPLEGLYADSKYYAVAFVFQYGICNSPVYKSEPFYTTAIEGDSETLTAEQIVLSTVEFGEISSEANYHEMSDGTQIFMGTHNVTVTPADNNVTYFYFCRKSSNVPSDDAELIASYYKFVKDQALLEGKLFAEELAKPVSDISIEDSYQLEGDEYTEWLNRNMWLKKGAYSENIGLDGGEEYTICAYGIDQETQQPTTAVKRFSFTAASYPEAE